MVKIIRRIVDPLITVGVLLAITLVTGTYFSSDYMLLSIISFLIASQVFDDSMLFRSCARGEKWDDFTSILSSWSIVAGLILFITFAAKISDQFSRIVLVSWFVITPVMLFAMHRMTRIWMRNKRKQGDLRTAVVVGANDLALRLSRRIHQDRCLMTYVEGFFEDRSAERIPENAVPKLLGNLEDVAGYIKTHHIDIVYITMPMSRLPRIEALMESLRDTTVSIYVVPDVFLYDLIQAHVETIGGVPVIGVRETPIVNINAFQKSFLDIILSLLILVLISPILLAISIGIKMTSPGPILFMQRRYGLGGEVIHVYKFRSMTVQENDENVKQATRHDARITKFGALLRRTSLDELPQFINVLQGRMSIVGPRPHAVSHNETYRKLISGYMIRHKVKPGITGWAQVNGLRGETEAIEKMQERVNFDLAYLQQWSLAFDLRIIFRTITVLVRGDNAY